MKRKSYLLPKIVCLLTFLLPGFPAWGQDSTVAPCKVGTSAPAFGWWAWPPKSIVKIYILRADFKDDEVPFILEPIKKWNELLELTANGVRFELAEDVAEPRYCNHCLTVMRGPVFDKQKRHGTELRAYSARDDRLITWGHIVVDTNLTNPKALTSAIAHELGHNFGLLDCYDCKSKTTVMNKLPFLNATNEMDGPTRCDLLQIRSAYKKLATGGRSLVMPIEVVDEGEEPEDDDTPIVLKKPE